MFYDAVKKLVQYGIDTGLTPRTERIYTTNRILFLFKEENYEDTPCTLSNISLEDILKQLLDEAVQRGLLEDTFACRDSFASKLMDCLLPRPAQIQQKFWHIYQHSPAAATKYYYNLSQNSNYIQRSRIKLDQKWSVETQYGSLDITINLSKPEKDPKAIAAAGKKLPSSYPKCLLCPENEGYTGRSYYPARDNLRIIPLTLNQEEWAFQYSPYVYYNEHCIVFNQKHLPMKIDASTFEKLFAFVRMFPHYFLGSNAELPIVGGSILSHEHFQGGNYTFAMAKAPITFSFTVPGYEEVQAGIVKWPLSVIRLCSMKTKKLIALATHILEKWRCYSDEKVGIFAVTDGILHNTITPIARKNGNLYELDLVLRNNITTEKYPYGVFHPHTDLHHIKKENIGLIEVMGLAVLPGRLKTEMDLLKEAILNQSNIYDNPVIAKHAAWAWQFLPLYQNITDSNITYILQQEIGKVFCRALEDAGVYKHTPQGKKAFLRFIDALR